MNERPWRCILVGDHHDVLRMAARISEMRNVITSDMDSVSPVGLLRLLRQVDAQVFAGFGTEASMLDAEQVKQVGQLSRWVATVIAEWLDGQNSFVVFTGSGTSGRLGYFTALRMNSELTLRVPGSARRPGPFGYLISGGPDAILAAHESAEDMAPAGAADLGRFTRRWRASRVVVVGISCGLSATYVGAQMEVALRHAGVGVHGHTAGDSEAPPASRLDDLVQTQAAVIGFNPVSMVRPLIMPMWSTTFREIVEACSHPLNRSVALLLNPVVGPEAVAGSTRMKGGTATKLLLDAACLLALDMSLEEAMSDRREQQLLCPAPAATAGEGDRPDEARMHADGGGAKQPGSGGVERSSPTGEMDATARARAVVEGMQAAVNAAYSDIPQLASLMEAAGDALLRGGRLLYLGAGNAGLIGVVDASECPPTYGADPTDVQAFWADADTDADVPVEATDSASSLSRRIGASVALSAVERLAAPSAHVPACAWSDPTLSVAAVDRAASESESMAERSWFLQTRLSVFADAVLPTLRPIDLVIVLTVENGVEVPGGSEASDIETAIQARAERRRSQVSAVAAAAAAAGARVGGIHVVPSDTLTRVVGDSGLCVRIVLPEPFLTSVGGRCSVAYRQSHAELALKLALNAVSTSAHVAKGCVFGNRMVNLSVTNRKLFDRAVNLIADLARVSGDVACDCLLRSIYDMDEIDMETREGDKTAHVHCASAKKQVVPAALLLALAHARGDQAMWSIARAREALAAQPIVRRAIAEYSSEAR